MLGKIRDKIMTVDCDSRSVLLNIIGAFSIKGVALIVSLLATPAYMRFFGDNSVLGLWYTLLSLLAWILNFDLGIGNGLRNELTIAFSRNETDRINKLISSAYISIGVLVVALILVFAVVFRFVNWSVVFHLKDEVSKAALSQAVCIVFIGIMCQFFLRTISSILYAMQRSSLNNFLSLITSIIQFLYVTFAIPGTSDSNLITMAIVHTLAVNVPLAITTIIVFLFRLKKYEVSFRVFDLSCAKLILKLGGTFLFVQLAYMGIVNTNEYLITMFASSASVVEYQIYNKPFNLIGTVVALALTPIWSAITKAMADKRISWIKKLYKKLLFVGICGTAFEFLLLIVVQVIFNIWLGDLTIAINYSIALVVASMGSLLMFNSILSSIANGLGKLKVQLWCFGIGAILKVPIAYGLVKLTGSWVGVILTNVIIMLVFVMIQLVFLKKEINQMSELGIEVSRK